MARKSWVHRNISRKTFLNNCMIDLMIVVAGTNCVLTEKSFLAKTWDVKVDYHLN